MIEIKSMALTYATMNMLRSRMVDKGHSAGDRLNKGINLAMYGFVDVQAHAVDSMESVNTYHISRKFPMFWKFECTCPDYEHRHKEVGYCKHIYAYICRKDLM